MKHFSALLLLFLPLVLWGQTAKQPDVAWICIGDSLYALPCVQTQTEVKPGWKIADVAQTKDRTLRYIWGTRSRQLAPSPRPQFMLQTTQGTLHDYALIRLKIRRQYRQLPKASIEDCNPIFVDLNSFRVELLQDNRYRITPLQPLNPGEYIFVDTSAKAVNKEGDRRVYEFTVAE